MKSSFSPLKFFKNALVWTFLLGIVVASCGKKGSSAPPVVIDKSALQDTITAATALSTNTTEGTKPGEYTVGSKATLTTAIAAANAVLNNTTSTQAQVTAAAVNLHQAIVAYQGNYITEIAAANLVGEWKMNGNANDSSGNGNNGTVTAGHPFFGAGIPTLTADRFGRANMAYHFDHGGNIDIPYKASLNPQQITISLWARQDTVGRTINPNNCYMIAMDRWKGYKFQTQPHLPFFTVQTDSADYDRDDAGIAITPDSAWYHLVVTFKSGVEDFYINGSLVKEWTNVPGTPVTVDNIDLTIGSDLPTNKYLTVDPTGNLLVDYGGFWTGELDDVYLYNTVLTAPQVLSIYNNQKSL